MTEQATPVPWDDTPIHIREVIREAAKRYQWQTIDGEWLSDILDKRSTS